MKGDLNSNLPGTGHKIGIRSVIQAWQCVEVERSRLGKVEDLGYRYRDKMDHFRTTEWWGLGRGFTVLG